MIQQKSKWPLFRFSFILAVILFSGQLVQGQTQLKQSIDLKNTKALQAELQINAGTFKLTTQDPPQVNASFSYTRASWKPEVKFNQGTGVLTIKQPEEKNTSMQDKDQNNWDIKLPRNLSTNLKFRMGAGQGTVNLSGAKLNNLEVEAGAGEFNVNVANTSVANLKVNAGVGALTLNLGGNRTRNLKADIAGGIGDLTLVLPRTAGVRVKVSGLGSVESAGLRKKGDYYVNDAYSKSAQSLDITVSAGLGSIKMELEK